MLILRHCRLSSDDLIISERMVLRFVAGKFQPNWAEFNVWDYSLPEIYGIILGMFLQLGLVDCLNISSGELLDFIVDVDRGYMATFYHSFYHAADVTVVLYDMLKNMNAAQYLTKPDMAALLLAGLCHDIGHPGLNNLYQVNAQTELVKEFGEASVLEKYSCSLAMDLCTKHRLFRNIGQSAHASLPEGNQATEPMMREMMIKTIMATDMSVHYDMLNNLNHLIEITSTPVSSPSGSDVEEDEEEGVCSQSDDSNETDDPNATQTDLEAKDFGTETNNASRQGSNSSSPKSPLVSARLGLQESLTEALNKRNGCKHDHHPKRNGRRPSCPIAQYRSRTPPSEDGSSSGTSSSGSSPMSETSEFSLSDSLLNTPSTPVTSATQTTLGNLNTNTEATTPTTISLADTASTPTMATMTNPTSRTWSPSDLTPDLRQNLCSCLLHAADISNAVKPWILCKRWSDLVIQEFFRQGDIEKSQNLPVSPNMDRDMHSQPQISLGFGDFVVQPYLESFVDFLPAAAPVLTTLAQNRVQWVAIQNAMQYAEEVQSATGPLAVLGSKTAEDTTLAAVEADTVQNELFQHQLDIHGLDSLGRPEQGLGVDTGLGLDRLGFGNGLEGHDGDASQVESRNSNGSIFLSPTSTTSSSTAVMGLQRAQSMNESTSPSQAQLGFANNHNNRSFILNNYNTTDLLDSRTNQKQRSWSPLPNLSTGRRVSVAAGVLVLEDSRPTRHGQHNRRLRHSTNTEVNPHQHGHHHHHHHHSHHQNGTTNNSGNSSFVRKMKRSSSQRSLSSSVSGLGLGLLGSTNNSNSNTTGNGGISGSGSHPTLPRMASTGSTGSSRSTSNNNNPKSLSSTMMGQDVASVLKREALKAAAAAAAANNSSVIGRGSISSGSSISPGGSRSGSHEGGGGGGGVTGLGLNTSTLGFSALSAGHIPGGGGVLPMTISPTKSPVVTTLTTLGTASGSGSGHEVLGIPTGSSTPIVGSGSALLGTSLPSNESSCASSPLISTGAGKLGALPSFGVSRQKRHSSLKGYGTSYGIAHLDRTREGFQFSSSTSPPPIIEGQPSLFLMGLSPITQDAPPNILSMTTTPGVYQHAASMSAADGGNTFSSGPSTSTNAAMGTGHYRSSTPAALPKVKKQWDEMGPFGTLSLATTSGDILTDIPAATTATATSEIPSTTTATTTTAAAAAAATATSASTSSSSSVTSAQNSEEPQPMIHIMDIGPLDAISLPPGGFTKHSPPPSTAASFGPVLPAQGLTLKNGKKIGADGSLEVDHSSSNDSSRSKHHHHHHHHHHHRHHHGSKQHISSEPQLQQPPSQQDGAVAIKAASPPE